MLRIVTTHKIAAGPAIVSGTHEGCVAAFTDADTVGLCDDSDVPAGVIETINTADGTCTVVRFGEALGRAGATVTVGTHYFLRAAADSRLDPAAAGNYVVGYVRGDQDAADSVFIPIIVHPSYTESA
jgi:hypothetical protein